MSSVFSDLCSFFGISASVPADFAEFIPWLFQIVLAIGLVWLVFKMFREVFASICGGGRRL